jgi:release factor glutamine methyltransferase
VTIHTLVTAARARFRAAGISDAEAEIDARVLAERVLGWTTERFFTDANEPERAGFAEQYERLVARRLAREPIAYIVGEREFWGLTFEVSPAVLIPRPETELIVEAALEMFPDRNARIRVADVCTGSGCLAVAIAHERPGATVVASDISQPALDVAVRNARRHGVAARVRFDRADLLEALAGPFDLIVSNPPYVPESDRSSLQPEVIDHEPDVALFAGADGLTLIRRLLADAPDCLAPDGLLIFEFGYGQADAVARLISETPRLRMVGERRDLQGIQRTAIAKRV